MTTLLEAITLQGQSVWYDNLSRDILRSGVLKKMIDEDYITGVTSNPTIFEKAIGNERIYDNDLHYLVDKGLNVKSIYEALIIDDIREAADLLAPIYEKTAGTDGYVSLEVSPELAYDKNETFSEASRLFALVDRPNLMIKIPGTKEGIEAFQDLIAKGINVNVTLLFSLQQYKDTVDAYLAGIERWISGGGDPAKPASVASFFVSRVDTVVDDRLKDWVEPALRPLAGTVLGRTAIANCKLAYAHFKEVFKGSAFESLGEKGAKVQKIVWASTSTKNPDYRDTYYVDELIGPETINTVPDATIAAFKDHGRPVPLLEKDVDAAQDVFPRLEELGVDMDEVMDQLLENGIKAFADSYFSMLEGIAGKRKRLLRGWGHRSASLGDLQKGVDEILAKFDSERVAERLWAGDVSLWSEDPSTCSAIAQRLGWLNVVDTMIDEIPKLESFADEVKSAGFNHAVLLGMGGSSLAAEVFVTCFGTADGYLGLSVLDTTVPGTILEVDNKLDVAKTLFIISSKSGGTIEVMSLFKYFWSRVRSVLGDNAGDNFIAITDPGTSLGKLAAAHRFRKIFLNPSDIGGRFSALSYFGLVPAALIGLDLNRLLMRASQSLEASGPDVPPLENTGIWLGAIMGQASLAGYDKLTFVLSPGIGSFGLWLEQLIAESTGKEGKGILPIDQEPPGAPEVYGKDRLFIYLRIDGDSTYDQAVSVLERAGYPVVTQRLHTPYDLSREMFRWEFATAVAGLILKINPFDQPNVQESKDITKRLLDDFQKKGKLPESESIRVDDSALPGALESFLSQMGERSYVALNAFLHPDRPTVDILQQVRKIIRDKYNTATTLGFGPRYLHSTGQIHKGGPDGGRFILITVDDAEDVLIPGETFSFGILKDSQAVGDYEALKQKGKTIIRIHLRDGDKLDNLLTAVKAF